MKRAFVAALLAGALVGACSFDVDPDQPGRFVCDTLADCGPGWVCVDQAGSDRGLCFPFGTCAEDEEACDGRDDDCNGLVDDVSWVGNPCATNLPGLCGDGTLVCEDGRERCVPTHDAGLELCNTFDDDCDGEVDEDFDFNTDESHCGACNSSCPAGTECSFRLCLERDCSDGADNDGDGVADCEDADCLGRACSMADPSRVCALVPAPVDGGAPADGGMDTDAGVDTDAGSDLDAGVDLDAGSAPDAGDDPDAGQAADAGVTAEDAGTVLVPACVSP